MRDLPKTGELYRHFKGTIYEIVAIARHSETMEELVVYRNSEDPSKVYARPLPLFMSPVDREKYPDVKEEWRFTLIDTGKAGHSDNGSIANADMDPGNMTENCRDDNNSESETGISEELLLFLEAETLEEKLGVLERHQRKLTDKVLDTMALSLDTEIRPGPIARRIEELKDYLLTTLRFEGEFLRERRGGLK